MFTHKRGVDRERKRGRGIEKSMDEWIYTVNKQTDMKTSTWNYRLANKLYIKADNAKQYYFYITCQLQPFIPVCANTICIPPDRCKQPPELLILIRLLN